MTGDIGLQLTILVIGFVVFTIAMVAGLITMWEWARRSESDSPSDWALPQASRREATAEQLV
ncbi:MAG: hypothetical protein VW450_01700, partial [Chloroflexota bacterium]